jgi:hypothetical protein
MPLRVQISGLTFLSKLQGKPGRQTYTGKEKPALLLTAPVNGERTLFHVSRNGSVNLVGGNDESKRGTETLVCFLFDVPEVALFGQFDNFSKRQRAFEQTFRESRDGAFAPNRIQLTI